MNPSGDRTSPSPLFVEVAVAAPVAGLFTYRIPTRLSDKIAIGCRILVPFGGQKLPAVVLKTTGEPPAELKGKINKILEVIAIVDDRPAFSAPLRRTVIWASDYYQYFIGEAFRLAAPAGGAPRSRSIVNITQVGRGRLGAIESENKAAEGIDEKILRRLGPKSSVSRVMLDREFGAAKVRAAIGRLSGAGEVELVQTVSARVKEKTESWVRRGAEKLSTEDEEKMARRAPRQHEIYREILQLGEEARPRLAERFHNARPAIAALEKQGLIEIFERHVVRDPYFEMPPENAEPPKLTAEQVEALTLCDGEGYRPLLLFGVTGSGKTEVYLHAIDEAIKRGESALVLVPEIALTPQLVARFRGRFGETIAVFHSGLSAGERFDGWKRVLAGKANIVIGARSAVFAPLKNLGVIIVDEEHEDSYKQEDRLRYNARDLAQVRGKAEQALVVLGSATPSIETYYNSEQGKISRSLLTTRVAASHPPNVTLVDLCKIGGENRVLSPKLVHEIKENFYNGGQTLLFLNRRGYSPTTICASCGWNFECPNCSVTLTRYRNNNYQLCHLCGYTISEPTCCPHCESEDLFDLGVGTERLLEKVGNLIPAARIERMDRDVTRGRGAHEKILGRLSRGETDILIGTQMIAKGLDFPGITLVGVVLADLALRMPDFRSAERTYALLTQVAGRSGRGQKPGKVVVQTFARDHYCIRSALTGDYRQFYEREIAFRREAWYPPFCRLALIRLSGVDREQVRSVGEKIADHIGGALNNIRGRHEVLGPTPSPIEKKRNTWRFQILVKSSLPSGIAEIGALAREAADSHAAGEIKFTLDIDPHDMLS